jgi:hypothetical protein
MNLYIEKEFLFDFTLGYEETTASDATKRLFNFISFPEMERYINEEITPNNLDDFEFCFAKTKISTIKLPVNIDFKIKVEESDCLSQSIFLLKAETEWMKTAVQKGALCFTLDSYEEKVAALINSCHFKIDLSEQFQGWDSFEKLTYYTSKDFFITDNYLLLDKPNQRIDQNCGHLFKSIFSNEKNYNLSIFTRNINESANATPIEVADLAIKKRGKLSSILANYKVKIKLTNNGLRDNSFFHDRLILTDFYILESTKGFNIVPWTASNSQMICESIFEKFTYKRLKNVRKKLNQYSLDIATTQTNGFKTVS